MRIIALGDTHGRTDWKEIIAKETFDKIVFHGDYFDTHDKISFEQQMNNFIDIINYKRENVDKVILLLGNHDHHYLASTNVTGSGLQKKNKINIQKQLHIAIDDDLIQMCFIVDNLLFSHAGITKTWCKRNSLNDETPIDELVNSLFKENPNAFEFAYCGNYNVYGDDIGQTPIWVRPKSLLKDRIDGFIQIVGHTPQDKLIVTNDVIFIDTLGTSKEYFIYDDTKMYIGKSE